MNEMPENGGSRREVALVLSPTAGSAYGFGWRRMKQFFLDLFLIILIVGAVYLPLGMIHSLNGSETPGGVLLRIFSFAYWLLLVGPVTFGAAWVFLKAVRGEVFEVKDMFSTFENIMNVVLAHLLQAALIAIGLVVFLVPGVILACRLAFVRYLVVDAKMEPVAAVKESWRLTRGHAWAIFAMGVLAVPISMAGLMLLGVGIIPAVMWIRASFASMYHAVTGLDSRMSGRGEAPAASSPAV